MSTIPPEPAPKGPVYAHVPWDTPTAPWVAVSFRGPAFSETQKDGAAIDVLMRLNFGVTSDIYRKLVEQEQVVDQFYFSAPDNKDPELIYVLARVKNPNDALHVRDEILRTVASVRAAQARCAQARRSEVERAVLIDGDAGQHGHDRRARWRASCATAGRTIRSTMPTASMTR